MRKIIILFVAFIGITSAVFGGNKFVMSVQGAMPGDSIKIFTTDQYNNFVKDSVFVFEEEGKPFSFETTKKDVMLRLFYIPKGGDKQNNQIMVYVGDGGTYTITGSIVDFRASQVSGDYYDTEMYKTIQKIEKKSDSLKDVFFTYYDLRDSVNMKRLSDENVIVRKVMTDKKLEFINMYPSDSYCAYIIDRFVSMSDGSFDMNYADSLYNTLSNRVKDSYSGIMLRDKIAYIKGSSVGSYLPNFTLTDISGKSISTTDYKGKWLLIDFWASWCQPCRQSNPGLVAAYEKYHSKGLEIIGVDCWDKEERWKEAIEKDGLKWANVNSSENVEGQVYLCTLFAISGIPTTFIVSPEGKIVYRGHPNNAKERIIEIFKNQ